MRSIGESGSDNERSNLHTSEDETNEAKRFLWPAITIKYRETTVSR